VVREAAPALDVTGHCPRSASATAHRYCRSCHNAAGEVGVFYRLAAGN
jgi:hypothetical protein